MKIMEIEDIILQMVQMELQAMHFYQHAAGCLQDEDARFHFELLADEEMEHARSFHALLPSPTAVSFAEMVKAPPQPCDEIDCAALADFDQLQALEMALRLERKVEQDLRLRSETIVDAQARAVLEKNIYSTEGHALLIAEDLERLRRSDG
ncbi:hypothetical protein C2E25_15410 [Geothermobacter hydrogeniphilus]|uniref:Rubrerythrin n=1 Tax=Geothermobacter hydrogeniphilus TaxID=1969733 RepID=A0A2K2H6D7_9BACT|nr:hypothetical protein [Geothermobacter hydrogeniphilus]PNU18886.1 hypothetical protein C2E25_15410 [Geothermobacter hydrogeniphilus]